MVAELMNLGAPRLDADPLPSVALAECKGVVISFYMRNISRSVVAAQRKSLKRFASEGLAIEQVLTSMSHSESIDCFLNDTQYETVVILDVDCVPISEKSFAIMLSAAKAGKIIGAAQRDDRKCNGEHLYAAPFCIAFSMETFRKLGSPSFAETRRGDVGEELTYLAEDRNIPVELIWPSSCEKPMWPLRNGRMFGLYTAYGDLFLHAFQIRALRHQRKFVRKIAELLRS